MTARIHPDATELDAYVRGQLDEEAQAHVEAHFFECDECVDALETIRVLRAAVDAERGAHRAVARRHSPSWQPLAWAAVLGGVVVAGGVALWMTRADLDTGGAPEVVAQPVAPESAILPDQVTAAPEEAPVVVADDATPPVEARPSPRVPDPPRLPDVAGYVPPAFFALTIRGAEAADPDEAFTEAMSHYVRQDFARAASALEALVVAHPGSLAPRFYFGVAALQEGRLDAAIAALTSTVEAGETPFIEEASFALAVAHLRRGDGVAARTWLERTAEYGGDREREAQHLLNALGTSRQ